MRGDIRHLPRGAAEGDAVRIEHQAVSLALRIHQRRIEIARSIQLVAEMGNLFDDAGDVAQENSAMRASQQRREHAE